MPNRDNKKINDTNIDEIIFIVNNRLNNRLQDRLLSFNLAISLLPKSVLPKAANNTKYLRVYYIENFSLLT